MSNSSPRSRRPHRRTFRGVVALPILVVVGCGPGRPAEVSPAEIPALEAQLQERPDDGDLMLRYAAALFSAERCDTAMTVARAGSVRQPGNALGPMVLGQCMERAGSYDDALSVYGGYLDRFGEERGAAAVRARELIARRIRADTLAQRALRFEDSLSTVAPSANTVAVLPIVITGDTTYQALGRGLAQMLASDIDLLQQFQLVERLQMRALVDQMQLESNARFDQNTVARMGYMVRAGRLVQGQVVIPPNEQVTLDATVIQTDGQIIPTQPKTGRLRDLLALEKELVVDIAANLGYQLSQAELNLLLENGTQNLTAFLAYSRGLEAEEIGDYSAAAAHYSTAVRADPGFQQARTSHQAATAAPAVQSASAGQVTTVAVQNVAPPDQGVPDAVQSAVASAVGDVAATQAEQTTESTTNEQTAQQSTQQSGNTSTAAPPPAPTEKGTTTTVTGTVRIVFRLP